MSKARLRGKEKRKADKKARRESMKLQYQAWAQDGKNNKSKRSMRKGAKSRYFDHPQGKCGNIGCSKCSLNTPANNPWLAPPGSYTWTLQFTSQKFRSIARPAP